MAVKYAGQAFVFKKENRLEADQLFSVFAKDFGRLEIFGKAIRKIDSKLRSGMEIFSFADIEFIQGKHKKTLTDALVFQKYKQIAGDPEKFAIAQKISGVMDDFIKGQELDEKIWDFIADAFEKLDAPGANNKLLYYYFFWNFTSLLGYGPELSVCATCVSSLNPVNLYFSSKEGGVVCGTCANSGSISKKINADTVKLLRLLIEKEWEVLLKLKIALPSKKLLKEISDGHYVYLNDARATLHIEM